MSSANRSPSPSHHRSSRAVASVNHLEIPAELAFVLSKLDGWKSATGGERSLAKVTGNVVHKKERHRLPHDIDYYAFSKVMSQ